jgi:hypothetical protein
MAEGVSASQLGRRRDERAAMISGARNSDADISVGSSHPLTLAALFLAVDFPLASLPFIKSMTQMTLTRY